MACSGHGIKKHLCGGYMGQCIAGRIRGCVDECYNALFPNGDKISLLKADYTDNVRILYYNSHKCKVH
jgi:hypothetical protein